MTLRFLALVESAAPDFPFQVGQQIAVTKLTAEMQRWIREGRAELVRDELETPSAPVREMAVSVPKRKR